MIKSKIYKVPFYTVGYYEKINATSDRQYLCYGTKGIVVVRKSILGNVEEILTGFNNFFYGYWPNSYPDCDYRIYYDKPRFSKGILNKTDIGLLVDRDSFTDENLASLDDLENWEMFYNDRLYSYFWRHYQEIKSISSKKTEKKEKKKEDTKIYEEQKIVIEEAKRLSKKYKI